MRLPLRALPALVLLGAGLLPVTEASAGWTCAYYKWHAEDTRWERVKLLQDEETYEAHHPRYTTWDCKYCYVPALPPPPDNVGPMFETIAEWVPEVDVQVQEEPVTAFVQNQMAQLGLGVEPFGGPACPVVAPEWDGV